MIRPPHSCHQAELYASFLHVTTPTTRTTKFNNLTKPSTNTISTNKKVPASKTPSRTKLSQQQQKQLKQIKTKQQHQQQNPLNHNIHQQNTSNNNTQQQLQKMDAKIQSPDRKQQQQLFQILIAAELQQYKQILAAKLNVSTAKQLKMVGDDDLLGMVGMSRPEVRRLRSFQRKITSPHRTFGRLRNVSFLFLEGCYFL